MSHSIGKFWLSCAVVIIASVISSAVYKSVPVAVHAIDGVWTMYVIDGLIDYIAILALLVINPYSRFNILMCIILSASIAGHAVGGFLFLYSSSIIMLDYITHYRDSIMASQILLMLWTIYKNDLITGTWASIVDTFRRSSGAIDFKIHSPPRDR